MDDETRAALELTKDDLVAMLNASEPANVARTAPPRSVERVVLKSSEPHMNAFLHSKNEGYRGVHVGSPVTKPTVDDDLISYGAG